MLKQEEISIEEKVEEQSGEKPEEAKEKVQEKSKNKSKKKTRRKKPGALQANLEKIKKQEGVIGYILRSPESASIDLKDPTKIIDYAVLSSTALQTGEELSETFELGEVQRVTMEGKDTKMLSLKIGDQRLSIFMNKEVDHNKVCTDLGL